MLDKKGNQWRNFELAIASLHSEFGGAEHNVKITGKSGSKHQIDAVFNQKAAIYNFTTLVSCKHWNSKVKKEHIAAWREIVDDCNASAGAVFSAKGFQSGAIQYAKHHKIYLFELKTLKEEDWEGCLKQVNIKMDMRIPEFFDVKPEFKAVEPRQLEKGKDVNVTLDRENALIYDSEKRIVGNFMLDMEEALKTGKNSRDEIQNFTIDYSFEPHYMLIQGEFYQITSNSFSVRYRPLNMPDMLIDYPSEYPYELIEITEGKIYPVNKKMKLNITEPDL